MYRLIIFGIGMFIAFMLVLCSCAVEEHPAPYFIEPAASEEPYDSCGNDICESYEDYYTCIDCVDPMTGGPKNGYCGDGICFNESMTSCFTDCAPRNMPPSNNWWEDEPFPGPLPPIPGPPPPF